MATLDATGQKINHGLVLDDKLPFYLDIDVEYQDWVLVAMCFLLISLWTLPCVCGYMRNSLSRSFTKWVYGSMHVFYWHLGFISLFIVAGTIMVLPDWTLGAFLIHAGLFIHFILTHLVKLIKSACILFAFWVVYKFRERMLVAAGFDYVHLIRFDIQGFDPFGIRSRKRPVEIFLWKVEDLYSSKHKMMKANDIFVECHLGDNEPLRTRVHNNAGSGCSIKESFQVNINESQPHSLMTILVKDQSLLANSEIARLVVSTAELCGIEDQTGKRRAGFSYSEETFLPLSLHPMGQMWIAVAPVDEVNQEGGTEVDGLLTC